METVSREWTVVTWNIQGTKRTDLDRLVEVISPQAPDVVVLQEVRRPQAEHLGARLAMTHCWNEKHHPFRPFLPGRAEGAAILTPHSLSAAGHAVVSDESSPRSYRRRILQWATVTRDDASGYRIYNAHLSPHDLAAERVREADRIARIVELHGESPPAVVAGDLNDWGEPAVIAALPGIEALAAPLSNPAGSPTQALDHVLVPPGATEVSASAPSGGSDWAELSDHLPVTVRFTLDWVGGGFAG
ncbi:MAG: endonuclease/exonuclease/phosphatase family protein [Ilumatobacter sp.]|uniref:endonuclease/exonuclease/phosphatase family protein n=1 Tax=Ilumatobacter sp. TaxID=1967498 RepID=UPI003296AC73